MPTSLWVLAASVLGVATGTAPGTAGDPVVPIYVQAVAKLLGAPAGQEFVLVPSSARQGPEMRARPGAGEAHRVSAAVAEEIAGALRQLGYRGMRGVRSAVVRDDDIQLVLGELRFEPPARPSFARLVIEVVGSDATRQPMEFLLKREDGAWRVLNMEAEDNIGALMPSSRRGGSPAR